MLRIITGQYKGRIVKAPSGIRPTSERVRAAIFNILGSGIEGKSVLELCAGSGVFGIEALSRGADCCTFVDKNRRCIKDIRRNIEILDDEIKTSVNIMCLDCLKAIETLAAKKGKFDIIFLDPPYASQLYKKCLIYISDYAILNPNGFLILEHSKKDSFAQVVDFKLLKSYVYGDTAVSFLTTR